MGSQTEFNKFHAEMQKDVGTRVFRASEAPPVRVISTGIPSLDVATGIGGFPRGTLVEVYGRESTGKTALGLYCMAETHRNDGFSALINLESGITKEGWLDWAVSIAPPYFNPERVLIVNAHPGSESVELFAKMIKSAAFDVVVYDSIGAMSTDKELEIGESKQAFGQSALVTQMIKQAARFAYEAECVPLLLNQVRDDAAGRYILEKAPGGHAKDHFATLRVHLKRSTSGITKVDLGDGEKDFPMFRVNSKVVKNKVGAPRRRAGWDYWDYKSPEGVLGIDTFQSLVDVSLQRGAIERKGAWFYHESFPDGKLNGGVAVTNFLRNHPDIMESVRRSVVMDAFHQEGNIMEERDTLKDAVI